MDGWMDGCMDGWFKKRLEKEKKSFASLSFCFLGQRASSLRVDAHGEVKRR